ncbi:MAG: nitrate- and nitrite sensing domain-containing protein [Thiotrichaceae bacterium]
MRFINRLSIRYKLILMLLLPIIGLGYFSFFYVSDKLKITTQVNKMEKLVTMSLKMSELVHQLQAESALSVALVRDHDDKSRKELQQQQENTDKRVAELNSFFNTFSVSINLQSRIDKIPQLLTNITEQRNVTAVSADVLQIAKSYHAIAQSLIDLIQEIIGLNTYSDVYVLELSFVNLLAAKELAGLERAILMNALVQGHFELPQYNEFIELVAKQIVYRRALFNFFATPEQRALLDEITKDKAFTATYQMREQALRAGPNESLATIDPKLWFKMQTDKIELLKQLQDKVSQDLLKETLDIQRTTYYKLTYSTALIAVLLLLTALLVFWVIHDLIRQLTHAVTLANAIAEGRLDNRIVVDSHDETGKLLMAFERMQLQLSSLITNEKQIAEEALRINRALDSVTTSVLITDEHYNIIYLNRAAQELFRRESDNFRAVLPSFDANALLGKEIGVFFPDSQQYHNTLDNLNSSEHASLNLPNINIDYIITPVINREGKRLGLVKEFRDRTVEVAMEREINEVIQAASQTDFSKRISLEGKSGFFKLFSEGVNHILKFNQSAVQDLMRVFQH